MWKRCVGICPEDDLRPAPRRQFAMAAHEVRMEMSLDHVSNGGAAPLRGFEILIDIALRIDNDRLIAIGDQVRSVCKASEVELLKVHGWWWVCGLVGCKVGGL